MVGLQGENSLIPYHEFLMFDYNLRQRVENSTNTSISDSNKQEETNSSRSGKKYKLQCIPLAFIPPLRSETIDLMWSETLKRVENHKFTLTKPLTNYVE